MSETSSAAVICGAGIAGAAAAYHLSVRGGLEDVVLVDEGPPLGLTSDKSTECYRNWWPGPGDDMVALVSRSIELLEELAVESGNRFNLNRRGYLFASADPTRADRFRDEALGAQARGVGPLREHGAGATTYRPAAPEGFDPAPEADGCDLLTDPALIRRHFPCLGPSTRVALHVRRCGWMSAQQLGAYLIERARAAGVRLLRGRVEAVHTRAGAVDAVTVLGPSGPLEVRTPIFVNAAGPHLAAVGRLLGIDLPVECEPHVKLSFEDRAGAVDRHAPLVIWTDPTPLAWSAEERDALAGDSQSAHLLADFPPGVHGRPDGSGKSVLLYWPYHCEPVEPRFPIEWDPAYPEIVMRGMSAMIPALRAYFEHIPRLHVDGGYYTKTRENRPLVGPLPVAGAYAMGAFSGFGIMAAMGAGELLAGHVLGRPLPAHAPRFCLSRYEDPGYRALLADWPDSGQL